jgi:hypothetical protein
MRRNGKVSNRIGLQEHTRAGQETTVPRADNFNGPPRSSALSSDDDSYSDVEVDQYRARRGLTVDARFSVRSLSKMVAMVHPCSRDRADRVRAL